MPTSRKSSKSVKVSKLKAEPEATLTIHLPVPQVLSAEGVCIDCRYLSTGQWYGPRCENVDSPFYKRHMSDTGTCEKFTHKSIETPVTTKAEEGLYDPASVTVAGRNAMEDLQRMIAAETEPQDVSGE